MVSWTAAPGRLPPACSHAARPVNGHYCYILPVLTTWRPFSAVCMPVWWRCRPIHRSANAGFRGCGPSWRIRRPNSRCRRPPSALQWFNTDHIEAGFEIGCTEPHLTSETLAFLQYTSGSTGSPKGVKVTHANLLQNQRLIQDAFGHTSQDVVVGWLPLYHDMGLIGNVLQPLYLGASCILMSPEHFLQKPARWLSAITRYRATTSGGPNFSYDLCVRQVTESQRASLDLSSWTLAFNGAEPVRAATIERFSDAFRDCGFRRQAFYPCYGLAEATLLVTGGTRGAGPVIQDFEHSQVNLDRIASASGVGASRLVGCGTDRSGQLIRIVHPEYRIGCMDSQVGEIWISGPCVAQGYWQKEEESQETFQASRAESVEGPFLRSGDLGFLRGGELFVTGRLKDLIIVRGRNHYRHDIERTVEESHPALKPGGGAAFTVSAGDEEQLVVVQEVEPRAQALNHQAIPSLRQASSTGTPFPVSSSTVRRC